MYICMYVYTHMSIQYATLKTHPQNTSLRIFARHRDLPRETRQWVNALGAKQMRHLHIWAQLAMGGERNFLISYSVKFRVTGVFSQTLRAG